MPQNNFDSISPQYSLKNYYSYNIAQESGESVYSPLQPSNPIHTKALTPKEAIHPRNKKKQKKNSNHTHEKLYHPDCRDNAAILTPQKASN